MNDCIESKLGGGTILLEADAGRYYYNSSGVIRSQLRDASGNVINFDNSSSLDYELVRLEIPRDPSQVFSGENIQVLFDSETPELSGDDLRERAASYINFRDVTQRVQR